MRRAIFFCSWAVLVTTGCAADGSEGPAGPDGSGGAEGLAGPDASGGGGAKNQQAPTIEYEYPCTTEWDDDADGIADGRMTYTFDVNGYLIAATFDEELDDVFVATASYRHDSQGNKVGEEGDENGDGIIDFRVLYSYDESGHLLARQLDFEADGVYDSRYNYSYDSNGFLVSEEWITDSVHRQTTYINDLHGNPLEEEIDTDMDGMIDHRVSRSYDIDGNLLSVDNHSMVEGERLSYTYDEAGNRLSASTDYGSDGVLDDVEYFLYDGEGRLVEERHDHDGDGAIDLSLLHSYDGLGRLILTEALDENGVYSGRESLSYECQ